ncbi:queuosine precursor transporter [Patescibacteria group bacterium]|nr:queuosine precursor transporter [Patescibacteria group bacterium]MBP9710279.1 queuosine precursor transporter [Patescibacteria group bacterium]
MIHLHKMDVLVAVYIFCIAVAELMGSKTITLFSAGSFHLTASIAILVLPLLFTINDVVSEVYGRERARSLALTGVGIVFLLACFSAFVLVLPPSARFAAHNDAYGQVFRASFRFSLASLIAFLFAELLDVAIFARLRQRFGAGRLWLRTNVSNILAQGIDTFVFMTIAFWHVEQSFSANSFFLLGLILPYWFLKCIFSVFETPFVYLGVRWLKRD